MNLRKLCIVLPALAAMLTAGAVFANGSLGDWKYRIASGDGEAGGRIADTPALNHAGEGLAPRLVIRRIKPGSAVELLVYDTHDTAKDNCEYKDWKISVDATEVPVLGYTFAPARTELKVKWGTSVDDFWNMFVKGRKLTASVQQTCDSNFGKLNPVELEFSLRGSAASHMFVSSSAEQ